MKSFYAHLREVALPCLTGPRREGERAEGEAQVSLVRPGDGGGLSVRLKSELAGLPFHWEFHCTPPAVDMVRSDVQTDYYTVYIQIESIYTVYPNCYYVLSDTSFFAVLKFAQGARRPI